MSAPSAPPLVYGDHLVFQSAPAYYYNQLTLTEMSDTLQNITSRTLTLDKDCDLRTVYQSTSSFGPAAIMTPGSKGGINGSLVPEVKPLQFQYVAFNTSDNYTEPNRTYFRIYDVDASREECRSKEVGPSVEEQKKLLIGKGSLRCLARQEVVDNNDTQVVKYTHHALVEHDRNYDGTCASTSYYKSCLRLVSMTSYSNGTKGTTSTKEVTAFPTNVQFRTDQTPCYYDNKLDALMLLGSVSTKSGSSAIVRIDSVTGYSNPITTLVRTLDYPTYSPSSNSLMNIGDNFVFASRNNLLAFSPSGDLVANKTLPLISTTSTSGFSNVIFHKANTTYSEADKAKSTAKSAK